MRLLKITLLITAVMLFAASAAFASLSYDITVDTSSLLNTDGYLYFQYVPVNATASTATVSSFGTDGTLGAQDFTGVQNGGAVSGALPGTVTFANTNGVNDYNHAIHFGNTFNFSLLLNPTVGTPAGGSSTFSLSLFSDPLGSNPLLTSDGTLFTLSLMNDGTATSQVLASQASVSPTPIPAAVYLFGSGLLGLVGIRRKIQN
jgi:hypothetical protein